MAGISEKGLLKQDSKNKFNGGVELEEYYGVNLYSTFYRNYDPQIGRFGGVDVLSERSISVSSYQFGINNPVSFNDPTGAKFLPFDILQNSDEQFDMVDKAATGVEFYSWKKSNYFGAGGSENRSYYENAIVGFWKGIMDFARSNGDADGIIVGETGNIISNNGSSNSVYVHDFMKDTYDFIGNLGVIIIADRIFTNLINQHRDEVSVFNFYWLVKNHGDWDLKSNKSTIYGEARYYDGINKTTTRFSFGNNRMTSEQLGNFHYGIVGREAGFGEYGLLFVAGRNQISSGTSIAAWQTPEMMRLYFGDDPRDQFMIRLGFAYYNSH